MSVREEMKQVLLALAEDERRLLSEIVNIEREHIHQRDPQKALVKPELLKVVRAVIL